MNFNKNKRQGFIAAWCLCAAVSAGLMTSVWAAAQFSWQEPHATVIWTGDLQWAPHPFVYTPGTSVIYIDYEGGSDNNSGTSPAAAFKHHPWDANATGNAAATTGIKTYVFKRGVIYRGYLVAKESGQQGNPIRLTSDPAWGTGEASLFGSQRVTTPWRQCTAADAVPNLSTSNVWYTDLDFTIEDNSYASHPTLPYVWTQTVCEMRNDSLYERINIARAPNWTITNRNDPMQGWWNVTGPAANQITLGQTFPQTAASDWIGGSVWSQWGSGSGAGANMATVQQGTINGYSNGTISFDILANPMCKYFIENLPQLLDEPNEYYYSAGTTHHGRFYVRLSGDRDPNGAIIEVGARPRIISLTDKTDIVISGLTFGITNQPRPGTASPEPPHWNTADGACQAIECGGNIRRLEVSNCKFRYVSNAISPRRDPDVNPTSFENVRITDNDIAFVDDQAITLGSRVPVRNAYVLRNKLYHIGLRQTCRNYSAIPAINVVPATSVEIAGNIVDYCGGTGINTTSQTATGTGPGNQVKVLVHHNKVTTSLLMLNDYGGIEGWEQGPSYFFNNISGNARGYRHFSGENVFNPWGPAIYFDHANRHVAINNIVWGIHNSLTTAAERNSAGFMQAVCGYNFYANNTIYNLYRSFCFNAPGGTYLGNLSDNISYSFHDENGSFGNTLAYAKNVYRGTPQMFAVNQPTFDGFRQFLASSNARASDVGLVSSPAVMVDPANGDFRPAPAGQAIGAGAKVFLPWNLPSVAGEWHFYGQPANYAVVVSEDSPAGGDGNVLNVSGVTGNDYIVGDLENWTKGALRFNGAGIHGTAANAAAFDVTAGSLILEAYVRTSDGGPIMSKGGSSGYMLDITTAGQLRMTLQSYTATGAANIKDGEWHHVLAELDRAAGTVNLYVDGESVTVTASGSIPSSLTSGSAFYVGRDGAGYFKGDIDFARVAKGSFADGATSFEELYAWQFVDGPAVRDFAGARITGARDAGALNYAEVSNLPGRSSVAAGDKRVTVCRLNRAFQVNLYGFAEKEPVTIRALTAAGRTLWAKKIVPGTPQTARGTIINTTFWARGVYLLHVEAAGFSRTMRLPLFR